MGFFFSQWGILVTVHIVATVQMDTRADGFFGNFDEKFDLAGPAGTVACRLRCQASWW